jgi:hypothetical protein
MRWARHVERRSQIRTRVCDALKTTLTEARLHNIGRDLERRGRDLLEISWNLAVRTENDHGSPRSGEPISRRLFKTTTFEIYPAPYRCDRLIGKYRLLAGKLEGKTQAHTE